MTTALDLITGSMRLLGVVRKGVALDNDEAQDGLDALNAMLASWNAETLIPGLAKYRENYTLTSASLYYYGTGQTFDNPNPTNIVNAFIRNGTIDYPLTFISDTEYDNISMKTVSGFPFYINVTQYAEEDYCTIRLYPAPTAGMQIHFLNEKALNTITLSTDLFFAHRAGLRAVRYNLALELAPEFGVEPSAAVVKIAKESLGLMKLQTAKTVKMRNLKNYLPSYLAIQSDGYL